MPKARRTGRARAVGFGRLDANQVISGQDAVRDPGQHRCGEGDFGDRGQRDQPVGGQTHLVTGVEVASDDSCPQPGSLEFIGDCTDDPCRTVHPCPRGSDADSSPPDTARSPPPDSSLPDSSPPDTAVPAPSAPVLPRQSAISASKAPSTVASSAETASRTYPLATCGSMSGAHGSRRSAASSSVHSSRSPSLRTAATAAESEWSTTT